MKITCTLNDSAIELHDEDNLHRRLVTQATVGDLIRRLWDIRDPETGEAPRITVIPNDYGVNIAIKGSDAVIAEVNSLLAYNPLG